MLTSSHDHRNRYFAHRDGQSHDHRPRSDPRAHKHIIIVRASARVWWVIGSARLCRGVNHIMCYGLAWMMLMRCSLLMHIPGGRDARNGYIYIYRYARSRHQTTKQGQRTLCACSNVYSERVSSSLFIYFEVSVAQTHHLRAHHSDSLSLDSLSMSRLLRDHIHITFWHIAYIGWCVVYTSIYGLYICHVSASRLRLQYEIGGAHKKHIPAHQHWFLIKWM